ncbi:L1 [Macaca mulata papillomavirus 1]|uniref:Major capsid protein L1 n=1 Tax=Macaca mulata papillomavirus 1 TaxID=2779844 RepID=VL1_MMPV1|nr:L1 protein [Alphapapillomavirus 12]P22163.2 RecName: Full=Major capsid protein L1 [Macaca mulata papillomavirus 1]AAA79318.1 L1 [Macaca mulata papillomavirus 1]
MSMWRPSDSKVYLPPVPVSKVVSTDEYVSRTSIYYHAGSSRLLAVGHPYYAVKKGNNKVSVPKVSGLQYRVFRVRLPDPNKFGLPDANFYDPNTQRLVWACLGVEVGRGQPLGVGTSGHPLLNKLDDTENGPKVAGGQGADNRECVSMDYKQTQLCMLGCKPPVGEHWGKGNPCTTGAAGDCPALELVNSVIQDGDMVDTGYGAMDFNALQANKSDVPIDICTSVCKYPDYLKMASDPYGDSLFFYLRREQMFVRHLFNRAGTMGDSVPDDLYIKGSGSNVKLASHVFYPTPSGSMVTSDAQLFNKPYWLQKAQGHNNGICWGNQVFLTVVDTTRSTNMTLCASTASTVTTPYNNESFKEYLRHVEEFDLQFIFQLCKVTLNTEVMAYIHSMDASILEDWNFGLQPPPSGSLQDTYRFVTSAAITCQKPAPPKEKEDPLAKYTFWEVDLKEKFSADLDQFPLGRKFLLQAGMRARPTLRAPKRTASSTSSSSPRKRKRTKR